MTITISIRIEAESIRSAYPVIDAAVAAVAASEGTTEAWLTYHGGNSEGMQHCLGPVGREREDRMKNGVSL
jgi:hypothetical protein